MMKKKFDTPVMEIRETSAADAVLTSVSGGEIDPWASSDEG